MRLYPSDNELRDVAQYPGPSAGGRGTAAHAERITISQQGMEASHDQQPAARGDVRWYRAATWAPYRARTSTALLEGSVKSQGASDASPAPLSYRVAPRVAIGVYQRAMAQAA
ncbi:MAG TPA: hypothetical protein VMK12_24200 [Anaeromyxobacteraceae bacterium]|nr:hypothetical protein [Anaeromyxobacteraceae bacterium]